MTAARDEPVTDRRWSLLPTLRVAVRDLFPTRARKRALGAVIGLSALTTVAELGAARFFSGLITGVGSMSVARSVTLLVLFLASFGAIKGVGYLQSAYQLRTFDRSLSEVEASSLMAESWQWPLAMEVVSLLNQMARLVMVTLLVAWLSPPFAAVSVVCAVISLLILSRGGRRQHAVQLAFLRAQRGGSRPTAAQKVSARVLGAERAALLAIAPILLLVAALGFGALSGRIAISDALVLFIATRLVANMYGTMAGSVMRLVRAQVYVYGLPEDADRSGSRTASGSGSASGSFPADDGAVGPARPPGHAMGVRGLLTSPRYAGLSLAQARMRLLDDGMYLGSVAALRAAMAETEDGPSDDSTDGAAEGATTGSAAVGAAAGADADADVGKVGDAGGTDGGASETTRPRGGGRSGGGPRSRLMATEPNTAWRYAVCQVGQPDTTDAIGLVIVQDVLSQMIVGARATATMTAAVVRDVIAAACAEQDVEEGSVALWSDRTGFLGLDGVEELLKDLGVHASLTRLSWTSAGTTDGWADRGVPTAFAGPEEAQGWLDRFVAWHNEEHYRPELGWFHPRDVHEGRTEQIVTARVAVLGEAYRSEPGRFDGPLPLVDRPPVRAWIPVPSVRTELAAAHRVGDQHEHDDEHDLDDAG